VKKGHNSASESNSKRNASAAGEDFLSHEPSAQRGAT